MQAGAPDKVVFEAAASCLPVIVSNPVFDELLDGLDVRAMFNREDPIDLAAAIERVASLDAHARAALGRTLRERVSERHSVEHWADGILEVAAR